MISIFYSTKNESKEHSDYLRQTCALEGVEIIHFTNKQTHSLAEAYNIALKESKYEILVCVHDDVHLEKGWDKRIYDYFQKSDYGILGFAGTTDLDNTGMWWRNNTLMVGIVQHKSKEGKWYESKYSQSLPNVIFQTVCVDGLFIGIHKNRIKENFDEDFKEFHFYDIPFCLRNHLQGVKIGVITDIKIKHDSVGMVSEVWHKNRELFAENYKEFLPASVVPNPHISNREIKFKESPSLAIIIPSKDNFEYLSKCLDSLKKTAYTNYKIYIADTGSNETTIASIEDYIASDGRLSLVKYDYYNFAKINNDVVKNHIDKKTELLLFCNDDIEMVNDAISLMVEEYLNNKKGIGTIGCRLYYGNNKIQHGGILMFQNKENQIGLSHKGIRTYYNAAFNKKSDVLGSTGAFLMIKKVLFDGIGGFNEGTKECFEDVLLNLDCIIRNYKNIYLGEAVCYHYESITRVKNPDKVENEKKDMVEFVLPKFSKHYNKLKNYITFV
jgi:GT2 family glycosyltransferase